MKAAFAIFGVLSFAIIFRGTTSSEISFNAAKQPYYRTTEFGYLNFDFHPNSKLEVENISQFHAEKYEQCLVACARNMTCFSINFGKQPIFFNQGNAQYLCELIPTDKYNSWIIFKYWDPDFNHYSIRSECSKFPCLNKFTCNPNYGKGAYECLCPRPPYEGQHCKDVDECTTGRNNCSVKANCINTIGSYECKCKKGYLGDGRNCTELPKLQDSEILKDYGNSSYLPVLKAFMDEVPEDVVNISWTRCWSGKNDGFDVRKVFHPQCDQKGPTITLVRKNQYIWGGYTEVPWTSSGSMQTSTQSFIFSLYNIHGFNPQKFEIDYNFRYFAVSHKFSSGPIFGIEHDIMISNFASTSVGNYNKPRCYALPPGCTHSEYCNFFTGIADQYTIDDIEVFYKNTQLE